jgi:rRNA maturation endonuclease Nob1
MNYIILKVDESEEPNHYFICGKCETRLKRQEKECSKCGARICRILSGG